LEAGDRVRRERLRWERAKTDLEMPALCTLELLNFPIQLDMRGLLQLPME
jgi:hypothetical protein